MGSTLRELIAKMTQRYVIATSSKTFRAGIEILIVSDDANSTTLLERLTQSIELIAAVQPRRLCRLQRDVSRIVIWYGEDGGYWPATNSIVLGAQLIEKYDVPYIASVLVHEATHARLRAQGIKGRQIRHRVELACLRAQMDFVQHVDGADELLAWLREWEQKPWWTPEQLAARAQHTLTEFQKSHIA